MFLAKEYVLILQKLGRNSKATWQHSIISGDGHWSSQQKQLNAVDDKVDDDDTDAEDRVDDDHIFLTC